MENVLTMYHKRIKEVMNMKNLIYYTGIFLS